MKALDCVAQGLGQEDFKGAMVEAAIGAMDPAVFQRMTLGLPPEVKAQLVNDIADDFKGLPAPWDLNSYKVGSYTGAQFTEEMTYSHAEKMENEEYALAYDTWEEWKETMKTKGKWVDALQIYAIMAVTKCDIKLLECEGQRSRGTAGETPA